MASLSVGTGIIESIAMNMEFQLSVAYDYTTGGSTQVSKSITYKERVTVTAETNAKTTVDLIIMRQEDTVIPFGALVRCTYVDDTTGELIEEENWQSGTWSGVLLYETRIDVHSEPL